MEWDPEFIVSIASTPPPPLPTLAMSPVLNKSPAVVSILPTYLDQDKHTNSNYILGSRFRFLYCKMNSWAIYIYSQIIWQMEEWMVGWMDESFILCTRTLAFCSFVQPVCKSICNSSAPFCVCDIVNAHARVCFHLI